MRKRRGLRHRTVSVDHGAAQNGEAHSRVREHGVATSDREAGDGPRPTDVGTVEIHPEGRERW